MTAALETGAAHETGAEGRTGAAPLFSLLLLTPDAHYPPESCADRTHDSIALQGEGPWEVLDATGDITAAGTQTSAAGADLTAAPTTSLAAALNTARGLYVAYVTAGDQLEPGALHALAAFLAETAPQALTAREEAALPGALYTDETWPAEEGADGIAAKPDFALRHLQQDDAIGRLLLVRRDLAVELGAPTEDPALSAAAAWDHHLRLADLAHARGADIRHVPVLGVWRPVPPRRDAAHLDAGRVAVEAHLARRGVRGRVELTRDGPGDSAGFLRVWHEIPPAQDGTAPLVSIVIPTGGGRRKVRGVDTLLAEHTVAGVVDRTTWPNYEIVLVTSQGTPEGVVEACRAAIERAGAPAPLRTVDVAGEFNFSRSINLGVEEARGQYVLLLNDDVEVLTPQWIDRMMSVAVEEGVGAVGAKLLFVDGRIQHVGVFVKNDGWVGHVHIFEPDTAGPFGQKVVDREVMAVTGACLLVRRDLFVEVGGMTEALPLNFNDVDLCLKLVATGHTNVVTPAARLHHFESSTRTAQVLDSETDALDWWAPLSLREPNVHVRGVL